MAAARDATPSPAADIQPAVTTATASPIQSVGRDTPVEAAIVTPAPRDLPPIRGNRRTTAATVAVAAAVPNAVAAADLAQAVSPTPVASPVPSVGVSLSPGADTPVAGPKADRPSLVAAAAALPTATASSAPRATTVANVALDSVPVAAAAAPVPVAGGVQLPADPLAAVAAPASTATPVAGDQPRSSFIRDVSATAAPSVALAPQLPPAPQPVAGTTAPALQVFGAAMHAAVAADERRRDTPGDATATLAAAVTDVRQAVPATADAQQAPLDMRQERWPHTMIDHIERLRDAADAVDTSIRLIPDALGTIDVSVKKDGDTVHVHFAAEQAATRAMLQEAQPRLAQAAEERGLRLGQTAVDAGAFGHQPGQGQPQRQAAGQPATAPARAAVTPANDTEADAADTGRIA
ncbi:flagellar hook-length control protein FliK [Sphingomonas sp. GC_Shp_5]|uniref:flagellar hook-length control protein FliK n=1 Tax=Sphingomonas sp. GC_Shp_5 TaxID=2937379 RepID=UPI00226A3F31